MLTLHVYGIDHSRAPIAVREDLAFSELELAELLPLFLAKCDPPQLSGAVLEVFLLSTCNRTEVYLVLDGDPASYPLEPLRQYRPQARAMDDVCLRYHLTGPAVAAHLFAVASALRSEMTGDTQISSQVAIAARIARNAGVIGPILEQLVAGALRAAKRVRRETGLAAGNAGIGPAVLQNLRRLAPPHPGHPLRVLLLGAGKMAEEVAAHLLRSGTYVGASGRSRPFLLGRQTSDIAITGVWARDRRKASAFEARTGIAALTLRQTESLLSTVDAVIGACRGRVSPLSESVLGPLLERRLSPLLVVDLGVPRNLDPMLAARDGVHAVFLDQLHQQMNERLRFRREAIGRAEQIVTEESGRFQVWWNQWPLRPIRSELYASVEAVLGKWRAVQPGPVRQLRIALHRNLSQTFGSLSAVPDPKLDFRSSQ